MPRAQTNHQTSRVEAIFENGDERGRRPGCVAGTSSPLALGAITLGQISMLPLCFWCIQDDARPYALPPRENKRAPTGFSRCFWASTLQASAVSALTSMVAVCCTRYFQPASSVFYWSRTLSLFYNVHGGTQQPTQLLS